MLLQPAASPAARVAEGQAGVGELGSAAADPTRWDNIVKEYSDVFEPPGMPADRKIVHEIELLPGAKPPHKR